MGLVHSPLILESAGTPEDRTVLNAVRTWRYRPALVQRCANRGGSEGGVFKPLKPISTRMGAVGDAVAKPKTRANQETRRPRSGRGERSSIEEFFNRLKQDMRRPKPGQDSVAAALQAIQRLALEADVEHVV